MPHRPPSDDRQLPKLRRFRLDADGSKVAREITAESAPVDASAGTGSTALNSPAGRVGDEVIDPDQLLDETAVIPSATAPTSAQREPDFRPPSRAQHTSNPTPPGAGAPPSARHPSADAPMSGPISTAHVASSIPRSRLSLLLGAVAAVVAIALVTWLVVGSASNDKPGNNGKETAAEPGGKSSGETSDVTTWANGVCSAIAKFEVEAMPIRAAGSPAGNPVSLEKLNDLQRQGSQLLTGLAASLQSVGQPSSIKELAALHVELLTVTNKSANLTDTTTGGSIGSPSDRAAALISALDSPRALFVDSVEALPKKVGDDIAAAPACKGTL